MLKIRMVGGFVAVACTLAAFASPALAFKEFTGKEGKVVKSSEQVFAVSTAVEVKCASVTGTAGKESAEQVKTKSINYEKCTLAGAAATVSGCVYNFHINGSVSLVGNECAVKAGECTLKIGETGNKELKEVAYTSLGTEKSELKANVSGISAKGSGGVCTGLSVTTAKYKGSIGIEGLGVA